MSFRDAERSVFAERDACSSGDSWIIELNGISAPLLDSRIDYLEEEDEKACPNEIEKSLKSQ